MEFHSASQEPSLTHDLKGLKYGAKELGHDLTGVLKKEAKEPKEEQEQQKAELTSAKKWKYTLITTIIFLIVANPYTYILVNTLLGKLVKIANPVGCPTTAGLLLHAVVFTLLLRWVMDWKL